MSLTEGDDIKLLGFNSLEEVTEKTKDIDMEAKRMKFRGMRESGAIDYEKLMDHTPTPERVADEDNYFQDEAPLYVQPEQDYKLSDDMPFANTQDESGRKNQYRFNAGDIVVYEDDVPQYKYRVIEFDPEEMAYVTQAIEGPFEGKYRDSFSDDLMTPPVRSQPFDPDSPQFNPESPPFSPKSPSYSPGNPPNMPSPEVSNPGPSPEPRNYEKELEEEDFSDEEGGLAPVSMSPFTPTPDNESDNMSYERTPEEKKTEEEFNEKGEKILNRISSLDNNPADNKGLEKLSTIEDEGKGEDEEGEAEGADKKKII